MLFMLLAGPVLIWGAFTLALYLLALYLIPGAAGYVLFGMIVWGVITLLAA